jgi:hypothetical protein
LSICNIGRDFRGGREISPYLFNLLKISWGALFEQRQLLCAGRCQCRTWWSATAWCPTATQSSSPPWTAPYSHSIRSSSFS